MTRTSWIAAAIGALAIALGAQVTVPMVPVPMTLQTLAVLVAGLAGGPRAGAVACVGYLGLVLLGLPVLADGAAHGGPSFFLEPSAGYVVGFVPAAAVAGALAPRGRWGPLLGGLAGHAVVLAVGTAVLAAHIGPADAWAYGCQPFLPGAAVKSLAAWALAAGLQAAARRRS